MAAPMYMRVIHRLFSFMIASYLYLSKLLSQKYDRLKNTLIWLILLARYSNSEEQVIVDRSGQPGGLLGDKKLNHAAIIVNEIHRLDDTPTRQQVSRLTDTISWLMLTMNGKESETQITVFDRQGRLKALADLVQAMIRVRLGTCALTTATAMTTSFTSDDDNTTKSSDKIKIHQKPSCELGQDSIITVRTDRQKLLRIFFISEEKIPSRPIWHTENLKSTQNQLLGLKQAQATPQMALVFNSRQRVLKLDGFPAYLKESVEIVECGELAEFRPIEYLGAVRRYGNTQQRLGA